MKVYPFIAAEKAAERNVVRSCALLSVSRSAYYDWSKQTPSARARGDERLRSQIRRIHGESRGTYGAPRVHQQLRQEGMHTARKQVARVMAADGLQGHQEGSLPWATPWDQPAPARLSRWSVSCGAKPGSGNTPTPALA